MLAKSAFCRPSAGVEGSLVRPWELFVPVRAPFIPDGPVRLRRKWDIRKNEPLSEKWAGVQRWKDGLAEGNVGGGRMALLSGRMALPIEETKGTNSQTKERSERRRTKAVSVSLPPERLATPAHGGR
jgi:hypothetical protein